MFKLFKRIADLQTQVDSLTDERTKLKTEVEDLKIQRKCEDENIRHMVKIKEEKMEVEFQKKEVQREREKQEAIAKVKDGYRDKVEAELNKRSAELLAMYNAILARLPDVNVALTGKIGGRK